MENKVNWDERFLSLADHISGWSKDRSSKVCSLIVRDNRVVSTGYNGFSEGMDDDNDAYHERPTKYKVTVHSEVNAIANAAKLGVPTDNATMYLNWFPCSNCAATLVNAGIKRLVCGQDFDLDHERWGEDFKLAIIILHDGGVLVETPKYQISNYAVFSDSGKITQIEIDDKKYGWEVPKFLVEVDVDKE